MQSLSLRYKVHYSPTNASCLILDDNHWSNFMKKWQEELYCARYDVIIYYLCIEWDFLMFAYFVVSFIAISTIHLSAYLHNQVKEPSKRVQQALFSKIPEEGFSSIWLNFEWQLFMWTFNFIDNTTTNSQQSTPQTKPTTLSP